MHDDAIEAINLEQLATMTDRLLLRAGRSKPPVAAVAVAVAPEVTGDRFSIPSLAKRGRQARVSPPLAAVRKPAVAARSNPRPVARPGATVHGYAPAPRGPEAAPPAAFAKGSISPALSAHEAFPPEPVVQSRSYERAPRARGSAPSMPTTHVRRPAASSAAPAAQALVWRAARAARIEQPVVVAPSAADRFEPERTVCVRPLPSPVPLALATRAVRALRSPSFAAKVILPVLVGAVLGLVAML